MPESAIAHNAADHVVAAKDLGNLLSRLTTEQVDDTDRPPGHNMRIETELARLEEGAMNELNRPGSPSGYSCPDCSGSLFTVENDQVVRFRCRVGHAWSAESLLMQQSEQLESALWMALRSLEEKAALAAELCQRAEERNSRLMAEQYRERSGEATRAANAIRQLLSAPQAGTA
jgi:two-component system chemotaxis response regulator CheB